MKNTSKKITIVFALFLISFGIKAQVKFGVRAGLNASTVSFPNLPNKSEKIGFHVGVFTDVLLVENFMSIQPELSYSTKGTSFKLLNEKQSINMNYVDFLLPISFKMSDFNINVGPFASYLISTPDYTYYNDNSVLVDAFKKFDAGLTAGLGYNFNKMMIGVRYNQGFIDVTEDKARAVLGSGKNAVGQISIGYKF
jgi:Outer membrane protein beta-barrel domain